MLLRVMLLLVVGGRLALAAPDPGGKPSCSAPSTASLKTWPQRGVWIRPFDSTSKRRILLTRADALAIRCALERHVRTPEALSRVPANVRANARIVGEIDGSDQARPRIGSYWVGLDGDEIVLDRTLAVAKAARHGLRARLQRRNGTWQVTGFNHWHAWARRP